MSDPYTNELILSWEDIHRDVKELAHQLKEKGSWDKIISITRGGLIPSGIVAYELDIPIIDTIAISSYDDRTQGNIKILKNIENIDNSNLLVIDDLVDTGLTFKTVREILPNAFYACAYTKPAGTSTTDLFIKEVPQNTWIKLPWDV